LCITAFWFTGLPQWVLCHEYRRSKRRCATIREMKEGPSGSAIRSLIPSHRKLLRSKAVVGERCGNAGTMIPAGAGVNNRKQDLLALGGRHADSDLALENSYHAVM
jgi:hypothetical protein